MVIYYYQDLTPTTELNIPSQIKIGSWNFTIRWEALKRIKITITKLRSYSKIFLHFKHEPRHEIP